jgi:hypothetical protein
VISYRRKLRLKDLEIFMLFKKNISLGYLIIEDLRRPLALEDVETTFMYMTEEDVGVYQNIIKVDILSDEKLSREDAELFEEFACDLVNAKDFCTTIFNYKVDMDLFIELPLVEDNNAYKKILESVKSKYDVSHIKLNKLMYLSQD